MVESVDGNRGEAGGLQDARLYKAREQILIDGVCRGLADYLHMSPTAVRAAFVVLAFAGFWGVLLYVLCMVLIPRSPIGREVAETRGRQSPAGDWAPALGFGLVVLGAVFFLSQVGLLQVRFWRVWQIGFRASWPLLVVILGWVILLRYEPDARQDAGLGREGLVRTRDDRMVSGVCAGLAQRLKVDVSLLRVLWSFLTVLSWGLGAVAYGILVLGIPEERTAVHAGPDAGVGRDVPEKVDPVDPGTRDGF